MFERSPSIRALGYPPHITLVRYAEVPLDRLLGAMSLFEGLKSFTLTFDRMGVFEADSLILWLSPQRDQRLIDLHRKVHETIDPALCDPHYRPPQWTPHLTIAMSIAVAQRDRALDLAAQPFEQFSMTFDVADCVSWPPVRVLGSQRL